MIDGGQDRLVMMAVVVMTSPSLPKSFACDVLQTDF